MKHWVELFQVRNRTIAWAAGLAVTAALVTICVALGMSLEALTLSGHNGPVFSVTYSPDGQRLASTSGDGTVRVWDSHSGHELLKLNGHSGGGRVVAFSPDGRQLAAAGWNGSVKVWNTTDGQETIVRQRQSGESVRSLAISPDGTRLALAGIEGAVGVWDIVSSQEKIALQRHTGGDVRSVVFSPDGTRLASAGEFDVKVRDAITGQESFTLHPGMPGCNCLAFSHDGSRLAAVGDNQTVKVWDARNGEEVLSQNRKTGWIGTFIGVAWSHDGKRLVAVGDDQTVTEWDIASGQPVFEWKGIGGTVYSVAVSPDRTRMATAGGFGDPVVKVWDLKVQP